MTRHPSPAAISRGIDPIGGNLRGAADAAPFFLVETVTYRTQTLFTLLQFIPFSQPLRDRICEGEREGDTPPAHQSIRDGVTK